MEERIYNEETVEFSIHNVDLELFPQQDEIRELDFEHCRKAKHDFNDDSVVSLPPSNSRFGSF